MAKPIKQKCPWLVTNRSSTCVGCAEVSSGTGSGWSRPSGCPGRYLKSCCLDANLSSLLGCLSWASSWHVPHRMLKRSCWDLYHTKSCLTEIDRGQSSGAPFCCCDISMRTHLGQVKPLLPDHTFCPSGPSWTTAPWQCPLC